MRARYNLERPFVPTAMQRQAEVEAGHKCSVAHCEEHTYLELHHINGNREDNRLENVILLCQKHHKMAHRKLIDRKSLNEYKRINRERIGLTSNYQLPHEDRKRYLYNFINWLEQELIRIESSPLSENAQRYHVPPLVRSYMGLDDHLNSNDAFALIDNFAQTQKHFLLLGNGGSGKTTTVLSWLLQRSQGALEKDNLPVPVFIPLTMLTPNTNLLALIRASIGKHGMHVSQSVYVQGVNQGGLKVREQVRAKELVDRYDKR